MKKLFYIAMLLCIGSSLSAQKIVRDTSMTVKLGEIIITANRVPVALKINPGAVSLVTPKIISSMPKSIAAEEALRLTPGVRIDNQHNGERVHISIRGQGILTERGLRGIGVILDGIPINDPSGFAPDLYDVDWATVNNIEVLRGPSAGLYGSGGSAGVLNISTNDGGKQPFGGEVSQSFGSNGFHKSLAQIQGDRDIVNYRVSYSRSGGDGYRDHQAYWSNKLYEKMKFNPSEKLSVTQIISHTDYFHQNPEGLNLEQFDNLLQANPDARPFNEYQKTNRTTYGVTAVYNISSRQSIQGYSFLRNWKYKETSNKYAEYRDYTDPGAGIQYNIDLGSGLLRNHFSLGTDLKWQNIDMYKLKSGSVSDRAESIDETNIETDTLLANQAIQQQSYGFYALYRMELGRFTLIGNIRYDKLSNRLEDKMMAPDTSTTSMNFTNTSLRLGASYNFTDALTLYANLSQGFIPPSTEELASNPLGYSGFNTHLVPATSSCFELGSRGSLGDKLYYDITGFKMETKNDFFRFKQSGRGNQEVFYGNAGNSSRYGLEVYLSYNPVQNLNLSLAYTYSDFKYTSAEIDPVYTDPMYVLTSPPSAGQYLPNSPKHQLYSEIAYTINKNFRVSVGTEYQSKWAIYTDSDAYNGLLDPAIYQNWQEGFNLFNARVVYLWKIKGINGECSLSGRNITGQEYMAFTEPDPDGNSYQPGPGSEIFGTIKINF